MSTSDGSAAGSLRRNYRIILSAIGIAISSLFVVDMSVRAWEKDKIIRGLGKDQLGGLLGGIDALIVLAVGLYFGWLLLFLFDESKNLQAIFILLGSVIMAGPLRSQWAWIDWGSQFIWLFVGIVVALLTGGGVRYLRQNVPREFPRAVQAILWTLLLGTLIAFFEMHVQYSGAGLVDTSHLITDIAATVVFVGTVGHFLTYSHRQDIFVLSTTAATKTIFMAELFEYTRRNRQAKQWGPNAAHLNRAITDLQLDRDLTPVTGGLHLRFRTQSRLSRWVSVVTDSSEVGRVTDNDINTLQQQAGGPAFLRPFQRSSGLTEYVNDADVIVFLFDTNEVLNQEENAGPGADGGAQLEKFKQIYDIVGSEKNVIAVSTHGDAGLEAYESESAMSGTSQTTILDPSYRSFIKQKAFGRQTAIELVSISRSEDTQYAEGIEEVVETFESQ